MEKVIFPDIEKVLVADLKAALLDREESYAQNVYVSTIKPAVDKKPYPSRIITFRNDGGPRLDHVRKLERIGVNIWCDTYADANALTRLVEALLEDLTGEEIKMVNITLSGVRVNEEGPQEHRYITLELITKGTNL
jgi:hypothetical protein